MLSKVKDFFKPMYLGYTEISFTGKDGEVTRSCTVHYFLNKITKRRKVKSQPWDQFELEGHPYYQKSIYPWLKGNNLWASIKYPSDTFKDYTEETTGYKYKGEGWFKPAQSIEGNVIKFPTTGIGNT